MAEIDREAATEQTPQGLTVPVPSREDFLGNLRKAAEPDKVPEPSSDSPPEPAES